VKEHLTELDTQANDTDLVFLKGLLDNPAVAEAIRVSFIMLIRLMLKELNCTGIYGRMWLICL